MSIMTPNSIDARPIPSLALPVIAVCLGHASAGLTVVYLFAGWFTAFLGACAGVIGIVIGLSVLVARRNNAGRKMATAAVALSGIGIVLFALEMTLRFHFFRG